MKTTTAASLVVVILILISVGAYYFIHQSSGTEIAFQAPSTVSKSTASATPSRSTLVTQPNTSKAEDKTQTVIGTSVGGNTITAYHFGNGSKEVLFVGGMHGGYEWNTALLAYDVMDYLKQHPDVIPSDVTVTVVPVLNPDGLAKVVGSTERFTAVQVSASQDVQISGRYNGNGVDINRNFDCDWQSKGTWQSTSVSGGTSAFSEPESQAIKQYITSRKPAAVVAWFSAAGGVYSSNCHKGVSAETQALTNIYAKASGYPAHESFDFYTITGDMTNWLAKNDIPAISVLLTDHKNVELNKNLAGMTALLKHYAK